MDGQFRSLIDTIDVASTDQMIRYALKNFAQGCGFERFAYLQTSGLEVKTFNSYPPEWQDLYLKYRYSRLDPVVTDAKRRMRFFEWSSADWPKRDLSAEEKRFRSQALDFGLRSGVTVPVEGSYGSVLMLTFATSREKADTSMIGDLQRAERAALAVHYRLQQIAQSNMKFSELHLTPTEASCLAWIASGKSMTEIAHTLNSTHRTVQHHLDQVRRKLNATRLPNAVAIAKDHGLI